MITDPDRVEILGLLRSIREAHDRLVEMYELTADTAGEPAWPANPTGMTAVCGGCGAGVGMLLDDGSLLCPGCHNSTPKR